VVWFVIWRKKKTIPQADAPDVLPLLLAADPDWLEAAVEPDAAIAESVAASILRRLGAAPNDIVADVCAPGTAIRRHWWGSLTPLVVTVSEALVGHPAGLLHRVELSANVVRFTNLDDARSYAFNHNGKASTTYAWVYDDAGNVSIQASVIVRPGDERLLRFAAQVASELYAAALGKFVYVLQQVAQSDGQWQMPEGSAPPSDFDPQRLPPVLRTNEQLLAYGCLIENAWEGLDEGYLVNWAARRFPALDHLFTHNSTTSGGKCLLPFIDALIRPDLFTAYEIPFAIFRCVPTTNPYIGPGLLCTTTLTTSLPIEGAVDYCNQMNRADLAGASGVTCTGTWMVDPTSFDHAKPNENYICFHSFFASAYRSTLQLGDLADEALRRVQFAVRFLDL